MENLMDWEEASRRFMSREPVEGVAFLLNYSVEVTNGPHRGSTGAVIALRTLSHDPIYVVELASGQDVELSQTDVVGVEYVNALAELERWYRARCNGDWEHSFGITICTLDNPGWSVSIQLTDTVLAQAAFVVV